MAAAGDFDSWRVVLDYYLNMREYLEPRTQLYWNHTGMWTTETQHLTGAYSMSDYGCSRPADYPVQYESSGWIHIDQGGDSGTGEYSLMALDYYAATGDGTYLPIAFSAADYFAQHYIANVTNGKVSVFPTQVLESWWCEWDAASSSWTPCCADDSPSISGMMTLFEKVLALPPALVPAGSRATWASFLPMIPDLPLEADGTIALARVNQNDGDHNNEGPELYAMHPHRVFTMGRHVATGANISVGVNTHVKSSFAKENSGWNYGLNSAALLGLTDIVVPQVLARAATAPAAGYRFPGFAPHMQDYQPSADHFANYNRALLEMLVQTGDDGFMNATIVLFPAWPCAWDVSAKLWAPGNTTVEIDYSHGALQSLVVTPTSRTAAVKWAACVAQ